MQVLFNVSRILVLETKFNGSLFFQIQKPVISSLETQWDPVFLNLQHLQELIQNHTDKEVPMLDTQYALAQFGTTASLGFEKSLKLE